MTPTDLATGTLLHPQPRAAVDARPGPPAPTFPRQGRVRRAPVDTHMTGTTGAAAPVLDVVIPVYNEEQGLEQSLRQLHLYLADTFPYPFRITVADNSSTDGTLKTAERVARELREVTVVRLTSKGRGNALRTVWLASPSPVLAYMDVSLSTDLAALAPWSPRFFPGIRTWRSDRGWHELPALSADRGGGSSPVGTTFCCMR